MSRTTPKVQRAILSVTDKTGLVDFARHLKPICLPFSDKRFGWQLRYGEKQVQ